MGSQPNVRTSDDVYLHGLGQISSPLFLSSTQMSSTNKALAAEGDIVPLELGGAKLPLSKVAFNSF